MIEYETYKMCDGETRNLRCMNAENRLHREVRNIFQRGRKSEYNLSLDEKYLYLSCNMPGGTFNFLESPKWAHFTTFNSFLNLTEKMSN